MNLEIREKQFFKAVKRIIFSIFALLALPNIATAQVLDARYAQCANLLASPPLSDVLTRNEGKDAGLLPTDLLGAVLLDVPCSRDQIVMFFEAAGWETDGEATRQFVGTYFSSDHIIAFCKPRKRAFDRWLRGRCGYQSGVHFLDDSITHISLGFRPY